MWKVQPTKERMVRRAYVLPKISTQWDTTTNSVSNANVPLPHGTALFYGTIKDNSNAPFANVEIDASAENDYSSKGFSDPNGNYAVAVLGGLTNEFWNCNVNDGFGTPVGNYILNQFNSLSLSNNQTVLQNFVALPATAQISGRVVDNSGNPIIGVQLMANTSIGTNNYSSLDGTTDNSGNYNLAVATGNWNVQFLMGGGDSGNLDAQGYVDLSTPHNVSIPPTNAVLNLVVYPTGTPVLSAPQRFSSTQFGFAVTGVTNGNYTVQVSTSLSSPSWSTVTSFTLFTNPVSVVDIHATNSPRFYRVQKN
jgi:hypothetical protein